MDLIKAMQERHAVRSYLDKPIEGGTCEELKRIIAECNAQSGLNIQLVLNEPNAFDCFMAHYGKFKGVKNYVALIGKKGEDCAIGYFGEHIALCAQALGLNTCWVLMSYKKVKTAFRVEKGEKLYCVLSIGYGATQGVQHKNRAVGEVSVGYEKAPQWFKDGVDAAMLAPTAMNQQKFKFIYSQGKVTAKGGGFYSRIDLGIAKYHFELGSGKRESEWN
ncbi:MAG: nitroreductase family protein [Candidatus Coproplasma sp.]